MKSNKHSFQLFLTALCWLIPIVSFTTQATELYPIGKIAIIVDNSIYSGIQTKLSSFITTLINKEGMSSSNFIVNSTEFSNSSSIYDVRNRLQQYYSQNGIEGAILIGAIPLATYELVTFDNNHNPITHSVHSVDYFYMDLTDANSQAWTGTNPWVDNQTLPSPWVPNQFESYQNNVDPHAEIWVSRIMCNNFTEFRRLGETTLRDLKNDPYHSSQILVINDYLQRAIDRMTTAASVPRRGFLMGDDGDPEKAASIAFGLRYDNLNLPYFTKIGNPDDNAANWVNYLRQTGDQGWEWAVISEHSSYCNSGFQYYHNNNIAGNILSTTRQTPPNFSYVDMTLNGGAPSQVLFFDSHGCDNANIAADDCLVQMYAMGHHGLIGMGKSIEATGEDRTTYYNRLGCGETFGKAFLSWLNSPESGKEKMFFHLVGTGTMRSREYLPYVNSINQICIDKVFSSYHFNERPSPITSGTQTTYFASISSPSSSFVPEIATYKWNIKSCNYNVNPVGNVSVNSPAEIEVKESGFLGAKTNSNAGFSIIECFEPVQSVGPCLNLSDGLLNSDGNIAIRGYPNGTGRLHADDSYDQSDNFIYLAAKETGNNVKSITTSVPMFGGIEPSLITVPFNWGINSNNYQCGLMVRAMNSASGTDANAAYVALYKENSNLGTAYYFQYRDNTDGHAHKITLYGPSPSDPGLVFTLERSGSQIFAYTTDVFGREKTQVGVPKTFDFSMCKWMMFASGQSNSSFKQTFLFNGKYEINYSLLSFKQNGTLKADLTSGKSGSLFVLGIEQTGSLNGLKFGNAASLTASGNVLRTSSLYNKKLWMDNSSNLTGGLVFRGPDGQPVMHISNGGNMSVRGGILSNMVTDR